MKPLLAHPSVLAHFTIFPDTSTKLDPVNSASPREQVSTIVKMDGCSAASLPGGWVVLSQFGQGCVTDDTKIGQGSMDTELDKFIEPGPNGGVYSQICTWKVFNKNNMQP